MVSWRSGTSLLGRQGDPPAAHSLAQRCIAFVRLPIGATPVVADNLRDVLVLKCTRRSDPVHGSSFRPGEGGVRAAIAATRWFTGNKNLCRRGRAGRSNYGPARRAHHSRVATLATARASLGERILTGLIAPTFRLSARVRPRSREPPGVAASFRSPRLDLRTALSRFNPAIRGSPARLEVEATRVHPIRPVRTGPSRRQPEARRPHWRH